MGKRSKCLAGDGEWGLEPRLASAQQQVCDCLGTVGTLVEADPMRAKPAPGQSLREAAGRG